MKDGDLLSIKEFARRTGINQSKLRHYDDVKLFQPVERGENGYRYYSAMQTISINLIIVLDSLNIPIRKIAEMMNNRTPESILELLQQQETELDRQLQQLQQAYSIIHAYSTLIKEGLFEDEHKIHIKKMPDVFIELGSINDFSSGYLYNSFFEFISLLNERNIGLAYPAGGYYCDMESFKNKAGQPDRYFAQSPIGRDIKKAGEHLVGYTRGYYGNLGDLPERMQKYADENGYTFIGPVYERYLHDEVSECDPNNYLIQASVPVRNQNRIRSQHVYD